ncbi:MAG: serine hydrolase, partial [Pseudomonadota bacterium]
MQYVRLAQPAPRLRALGVLIFISLLAACASSAPTQNDGAARTQLTILEAIAPVDAPVEESLPLSVVAIKEGSGAPQTWVAGRGKVPPQAASRPMRVASISKLAVAIVAMSLVEEGTLDLDQDISEILGWTLRHKLHPDVAITARMLLSHQSGLSDGADYQIALPATLQQLMSDERFYELPYAPGTYFKYANINYGVLGTVMEAVSGERAIWIAEAA